MAETASPTAVPRLQVDTTMLGATSTSQMVPPSPLAAFGLDGPFGSSSASASPASLSMDHEPLHPLPKQGHSHNSDTTDCSPWAHKLLMTLDGGGIRGYASLLILKELVTIIHDLETGKRASRRRPQVSFDTTFEQRPGSGHYDWFSQPGNDGPGAITITDKSPSPRGIGSTPPDCASFLLHHYFDYIAGTSTGGLSALVLSRMQMDIDTALAQYDIVGNEVFGHPRKFEHGAFRPRYKTKRMETAIQKVVETGAKGERNRTQEVTEDIRLRNENPDACHTIAIAHGGPAGTSYLFRSFEHPQPPLYLDEEQTGDHLNSGPAHEGPIWEVARATSAAPGYFSKMHISGHDYRDGGMGANNPGPLAFTDISQIHDDRPPYLVLSIGTGKPEQKQVQAKKKDINLTSKNPFGHFLDWKNVVGVLAHLATDAEEKHKQLAEEVKRRNACIPNEADKIQYYRFNVPGISDIKLDNWEPRKGGEETKRRIREATEAYLNHRHTQRDLIKCATQLVILRRRRAESERWERYANHIIYTCPDHECPALSFKTRSALRQHAIDRHGLIQKVSLDYDGTNPACRHAARDAYACTWQHGGQEQVVKIFTTEGEYFEHLKEVHKLNVRPVMTHVRELEAWLDRGRTTPEVLAGMRRRETQSTGELKGDGEGFVEDKGSQVSGRSEGDEG